MGNLLKAFFFKLKRDLTFRITLIVAGCVALFMMTVFLLGEHFTGADDLVCNGSFMFTFSFTPYTSLGIAIPINLINFTVLEFSSGIIRNKIIAGNSKFKLYLSIFVSGLIFMLLLLFAYVGFSTLLGIICGGFDPSGLGYVGLGVGLMSPEYLYKFFITCVFVYITVTAFTIFISTVLRTIGPCIPICIVSTMILSLALPTIVSGIQQLKEQIGLAACYINPFQVMMAPEVGDNLRATITNEMMVATTVCNVFWTLLFTGFGTLIFVKRDVK